MQLIQHLYSDKAARYYIDGRRVSRDKYEHTIIKARIAGQQLCCFHTRAKQYGQGLFHRINYSSIN